MRPGSGAEVGNSASAHDSVQPGDPVRDKPGTDGEAARLRHWLLLGLTGSWLLAWSLFAGLDNGPFDHWVRGVILAQVGGGLLVAMTAWVWRRERPGRRWLALVLLAAVLFRVAAMPASRDLSDDAYRYHWDGKVLTSGINPYLHAPDAPEVAHLHLHLLDTRINHPWYRTCYPPLAELLFAAGYRLTPGKLTGLNLLSLLAEILTWGMLIIVLHQLNQPLPNLLLTAWCPLLIFQGYLPGHLDLLYLPFFTLFILMVLNGRAVPAGIGLALACLIKPLPLLQMPAAWRELGWRRGLALSGVLTVVAAAFYLPFRGAGFKLVESTWLMAREWSFNGSLGTLCEQLWPRLTAHYLAGALLCGLIILATWRGSDLLARMLMIQAAFIICTPTLFPWYLAGMFPLLALRPDPALLALGILIPLADEVLIHFRMTGTWAPAMWVSWAEYVPFYLLLVISAWRGWGMFARSARPIQPRTPFLVCIILATGTCLIAWTGASQAETAAEPQAAAETVARADIQTTAGNMTSSAVPTDSSARREIDPRGCLNLQWENDAFSLGNIDGHYTNGMRVSYLVGEDRIWPWVAKAARALPFYPDGGRLRSSYALGQNLYTPEYIGIPEPIPDDRPYAAWLYLALGLIADNDRILDSVELSLGVVGPAALGEEVQKGIHNLIGSPEPKGWAHQLQNELTLQLIFGRVWRKGPLLRDWAPLRAMGLEIDFTPHISGALGNVFIYGAGGGSLRLGNDLPADYGPPRIRPSLPGSGFFVPSRSVGWYLFAGIEGRIVARNIFLDGNTFKESLSVDRNLLVGDIQAGLAMTLHSVRLAFTYVLRAQEFATQRAADQFGSWTLSVLW